MYEPRIAPNTGNAIRLVANNGSQLHLIEPLGFDLEEKKLRRAGLDYHDLARVHTHRHFEAFLQSDHYQENARIFAVTTKGTVPYTGAAFKAGDVLLFGSETHGLPDHVMEQIPPERRIRIPMIEGSRSLNLSNAIAIVSYEAWRQSAFA